MVIRKHWGWVLIPLALAAFWLLPISGKLILAPEGEGTLPLPLFRFDPAVPQPGERVEVAVTDTQPWAFVQLTVAGQPAEATGGDAGVGGAWTWRWSFIAPDSPGYVIRFFHDCHTGCIERGRVAMGTGEPTPAPSGLPTKLGLVFPDPERDWRGRAGWAVELTYARQAEEPYWGVDDLAARVAAHRAKGLNVLLRVDYAQQQSLPPADDYLALTEYLAYLRRLARDNRLGEVYGVIIGTDYNTAQGNALSPEQPVTPAWYARLFNGYGEDVSHTDNAVQVVHSENPNLRVIVGPIRPWVNDQDGELPHPLDVPWLNYMNTVVTLLDAAARAKSEAGVPLAAPDGFDVQAPGRVDAPELAGQSRAEEPRLDLRRASWNGAQAGFRVYHDWLTIINAYPTTRGLPVYIVSTNTYDRAANSPPAQNYPDGWLTTALETVGADPQIVALCWFLDAFPHGNEWDWFSLTEHPGRLVDAAEEFDALLMQP
ncbi:MAG: hypothetical protein JXB35_02995 [Anaerolineae bacterium]|nr:hypothetical protein [Anaerolineae bacterium]